MIQLHSQRSWLSAGITALAGTWVAAAQPAPQPTVYTTFYPTTYLVERIGGDKVRVVNPCPPDKDPAYWQPDEATIAAYQGADLIVLNGAQFEKWVAKATLPRSKMVDTTHPLRGDLIKLESAVTHKHGPEGAHTHEGIDGHTWLDPRCAQVQAEQIAKGLTKLLPQDARTFERNLAAVRGDLDKLDARVKAVSQKLGDQQLLGNHPAWNYLARRYGWKIETFVIDPEAAALSTDEATKLKEQLGRTPAKLILFEAEPTAGLTAQLKDLGLTVVLYEPGEALTPERKAQGVDFLSLMSANVERLEQALAQ